MLCLFKCAKIFSFIALFLGVLQSVHADPCTYKTWEWDTVQKKSVHHRTVSKAKAELTKEEQSEVKGCTVCQEDQVDLRIDKHPLFKVCKKFAAQIKRAIEKAQVEGFVIDSIVGYRVGKSKGPIDSAGLRTEFSNHSFGTAVDFNSEKNGLYDFCIRFGPECRLIRGGPYLAERPGSITVKSPIYKSMREVGFKWGGQIAGKQKDFMHFSLNGM